MKLTLEEFKAKASEYGARNVVDDRIEEKPRSTCAFKKEWCIGGQQGGSCWDEGTPNYYSTPPDIEPEMEQLDKLLEVVTPNLTFLQYKGVLRLIKRYKYSDDEYYGNYTDYMVKYIDIEELWNYLKGL